MAAERNENQVRFAEFTPIVQPSLPQFEQNCYPFMDNQVDFAQEETSALSLGSQETFIDAKYGEIILESFSLVGTPIQYRSKNCGEDSNSSLLKTEKLMRTAATSMQDENEDQSDSNSTAMEVERDL